MKRNSVLKMALATFLAAQVAMGAPGQIDFTLAPVIKNIKPSKDNPVNLHQSTVNPAAIDHANKFFTTRTMFRLGPAGLDANDQKLLRNEICASNSIYESGVARALDLNKHPGSWGVYKKGRDIVSVADIGMAGKPLNQVLRELSKQPDADKVAIAKYFAVAMTRNLEVIHAGDVIWNNLDLSNFYVRPDGGTYAFDFTESKLNANAAAKDAEFNALVAGPVLDMYRILFPIGDEAANKFSALIAQPAINGVNAIITAGAPADMAGVQALVGDGLAADLTTAALVAAGLTQPQALALQATAHAAAGTGVDVATATAAALKVVGDWFQDNTIAISEALFTATLNAALPGARDAAVFNAKGLGPDGGGAANYANADAYLLNKPAAINVVAHGYVNVAINDQEAMAGAVGDGAFTNGFFLDPAILPLVPAPGGVVHVNKAALCARWTGL